MKQLKLVICVILVFLVGLLAGAVVAKFYYKARVKDFAAGGPPQSARIRMLLDRFSHDLELTDKQKAEIEEILRDVQDEIFQLNRETFPQIEEINEKGLEQIKSKLDSKQKEKFNTFQNKIQKFHDRFAVRLDFPGKMPTPDIGEMLDRLDLTSEQVSEIQKIMEEGFQKREQIMEMSRGKEPPDFSKIRQEMRDSEETQRKMIEKILTPDQVDAFNKYMEERRPPVPPIPGSGPNQMGDPNRPPGSTPDQAVDPNRPPGPNPGQGPGQFEGPPPPPGW